MDKDYYMLQERINRMQKLAKIGDWYNNLKDNRNFWSDEIYSMMEIEKKENDDGIEKFMKYVHPEDYDRVMAANYNATLFANDFELEFRIITPEGKLKWMHTYGKLELDSEGKIECIHGVMQDITDAKKAEETIVYEKIKAEKLNEAKTIFLANINHEIRTPISGILGMTNLLRHTVDDDESKNYLKNIKYSCDLLLKIINDVLDFTKLESNKVVVENQRFDIKVMLSNIKQMYEYRALEKNIDFNIKLDSNIKNSLKGDYVRIHQILTNFIGNAIKFTHQGEVSLNVDILDKKDDFLSIQFLVKDTGIGISKNRQKEIFDIFNQGDTSYGEYGGTGLGLSISKKLIEAMGGKLIFSSEIGRGSTFGFVLELEEDMCNIQEDEFLSQYDIDQELALKILVMEDDKINRLYLQKLLNDILKNRIDLVENGKIGLKAFRNGKYDCVLIDGRMPIMGGYEVVENIRNTYKSDIDIIIMTADLNESEMLKYKDIGANYCIKKPIIESKLIEIINEIKMKITKIKDVNQDEIDNIKVKFSGEYEIIDLNALNQSLKIMGDGKMKSIIRYAIEEYRNICNQIYDGINTKYYDTSLINTLHKLKGTIGYFSPNTIGSQIQMVENVLISGYKDETVNLILDFHSKLEQMIEELGVYKDNLL